MKFVIWRASTGRQYSCEAPCEGATSAIHREFGTHEWHIEISNLKQLMQLVRLGGIILLPPVGSDPLPEIVIYDDYYE